MLTLVLGNRGDGKNFFVLLSVLMSERPIYSNFFIDNPRYHHCSLKTLLYLPDDIELCIDEPYAIMDPRLSMSYINMFMGYIATQLRKTERGIFLSVTQYDMIEKRYRTEWDYMVLCSRLPNESKNWKHWDFTFIILDKKKQNYTTKFFSYEDAKDYFKYYDTNEIIEPRNKSRMEYEVLKNESQKELIERAREIAIDIKPYVKRYTKNNIALTLMGCDYDPCWKNEVFLIYTEYFNLK